MSPALLLRNCLLHEICATGVLHPHLAHCPALPPDRSCEKST